MCVWKRDWGIKKNDFQCLRNQKAKEKNNDSKEEKKGVSIGNARKNRKRVKKIEGINKILRIYHQKRE